MFQLKSDPASGRAVELHDARSAATWLAELPRNDLRRCVAQLAAGLTTFNSSDLPLSAERLAALMLVDEESQAMLNDFRLSCVLEAPSAPGSSANGGWADLEGVYKQLARGYQHYIALFVDNHGAVAGDEAIELLTGRAMHAIAQRAKIAFLHQQVLPGKYWRLLHRLYRFAETHGFARRPLDLFAKPAIQASCSDVYLRVLLLATANSGGLTAKQLEITDDWLATWARSMSLELQFDPKMHFYYVHLGEEQGARRIFDLDHDKLCRYINTQSLALQIDRAKRSFREGQVVSELGLHSNVRGVEFMNVLERLERTWSSALASGDQRGHMRVRASDHTLTVVRGLADICKAARREFDVANAATMDAGTMSAAEELDLKVYGFITERTRNRKRDLVMTQELQTNVETWPLQDESINGYGAILPLDMERNLAIGTLLGVKVGDSKRWAVGMVVRKLTRRDTNEVQVGIELISLSPVIVTLGKPETEMSLTHPLSVPATRDALAALFIPGDKSKGRSDSLLIDIAMYGPGRKYTLNARNVSYYITMSRVMRTGAGWQRVSFEVLSKRS